MLIISEKQGNVSNARNIGVDHAKGEWLTFVDADDRVDPNHLQLLFDATLTGNPDIIISGYTDIAQDNRTLSKPCSEEQMISKKQLIEISNKGALTNVVWNQLYRVSVIESQHIRFDERITYGEDTIFSNQCFLSTELIKVIPQSGYKRIIYQASAVSKFHENLNESVKKRLCCKCELMKQAGYSANAIEAERIQVISGFGFLMVRNCLKKDCPYTFREKLHEIRRVVFDDPEVQEIMRSPLRKKRSILRRIYELPYDLHSPLFLYLFYYIVRPFILYYRNVRKS